jgi:hypothetical protein
MNFLQGDLVRDRVTLLNGLVVRVCAVRVRGGSLACLIVADCYDVWRVMLCRDAELIACGICQEHGEYCTCQERDPRIAQVFYTEDIPA